MGKPERPPSFQFYPRDFLSSQHVCAMTVEQVGAYILLLCHAWLSDEPGTLPNSQELLAALSRTSERWPGLAPGVLSAWLGASGKIIQPRMVEERAAQKKRYQRSVQGGKSRASGARDSRGRLVSSQESRWTPPPASASASALEEAQSLFDSGSQESSPSQPCPPRGGRGRRKPSTNGPPEANPKAEWLQAFDEDFYPEYPRKVKPDAARRAWLATKPWTQENCDRIYSGLVAWTRYWLDHETPKDKIPYPAAFLNGGQWKEKPQ